MPVFIFFTRLDLEQKSSFMDGHYVVPLLLSNSHHDNPSRYPYRPWLIIHRAVADAFF